MSPPPPPEQAAEGPNKVPNTLLPLAAPAVATLQHLARLVPGAQLRPSPFCYEDQHEVRGWALDLPGDAPGAVLPVPHTLFHGIAMARCEIDAAEALCLMQDASGTRARLAEAVRTGVGAPPVADVATWARCKPTLVPPSLHAATRDRDGRVVFEVPETQPPLLEHARWVPELSPDGFVGLFFEWSAEDQRLHMFLACQSYLPHACAEFADMAQRAGRRARCTAAFLCLSDEAQWLRAACARNRARILAKVSEHMRLKVPLVSDYCGAGGDEPMALVHTETLHHDLVWRKEAGGVRLLSYCAPESLTGSLCAMAPWDGLWLFRGGRNDDGRWLFPTTAPRVKERVRPWSFTVRPRNRGGGKKSTNVVVDMSSSSSAASKDNNDNDNDDDVDALLRDMMAQTRVKDEAAVGKPQEGPGDDAVLIRDAYKRALGASASLLLSPQHQKPQPHSYHHLMFDETVLQRMVGLGWVRALGYAKLMPLGVVPWHASLRAPPA